MNVSLPLLRGLLFPLFPRIERWIDAYLAETAGQARTVASQNFSRLPLYFSGTTLAKAKVIASSDIRKPPLAQFGLKQFKDFERMNISGITYKDTYLVTPSRLGDESLHFHELIHVIQWRVAGPRDFMLAYAAGLMKFGYWHSPLERMAYGLQARFDAREEIPRLEALVEQQTRVIVADPLQESAAIDSKT